MEDRGGEIHVDTDEARGGSSPNVVRWVLGIGLLLAILLMSLAWIIPALSRGGETQNVSVSRAITGEARDGSSGTDSIVGEDSDEIPAAGDAPSEGGIPTIDNENQPADTSAASSGSAQPAR